MQKRNRFDSGIMTNRTMNKDTYELRRMVMAHIYNAKRILINVGYALPRIDVRIGDRHDDHVLGCARMGDNIIWIDASTAKQTNILQHVVYHELCHAVRAIEHVNGCPLMGDTLKANIPPATIEKLFIKYMTE